MRRPIPILVLVTALTAVLSACGGSDPAGSAPAAPAPATVRLIAHDSFVVSEQLIADLKAQTGITLEVITGGDAGTVVAGAILAAGAPTADVLFGVDNTLVSKAVDAGVFAPYSPAALETIVPALRDDTAGGLVTPIDYGDVCVNIDDTWFAERGITPPATLDDLAEPEYRDLLVVQDPATSSPGLAFILATIATYGHAWPD